MVAEATHAREGGGRAAHVGEQRLQRVRALRGGGWHAAHAEPRRLAEARWRCGLWHARAVANRARGRGRACLERRAIVHALCWKRSRHAARRSCAAGQWQRR